MSLLDELQNEVKIIRAREAQQDQELAAQQAFYTAELRPVMLRAYEYYAQIIENLNIVDPDIKVGYPLDPLMKSRIKLLQENYKFRSDNKETPHQIDIFCQCTLQAPHEFYLSGPKAVETHAELLDNHDFRYHRKNRLDRHHNLSGATFILEGPMVAHIRIAASPADRNINITFRNIEEKPLNRYVFAPDEVDDALLERIAKVFIRKLPMLIDRTLDPVYRDQLRSQIERDKRETAQDIAQAYSERAREQEAERNAKLITRTKKTVTERVQGLRKYFSTN